MTNKITNQIEVKVAEKIAKNDMASWKDTIIEKTTDNVSAGWSVDEAIEIAIEEISYETCN